MTTEEHRVVSESTPKKPSKPTVNKPPKGKNGQLPIFDAKPRKSTGPCLPDSTCKDPNDVCQKSDGNCFPKGTPGLNDSDNSSSSTDSDDSDDSDDSSQKKKRRNVVETVQIDRSAVIV
ncbi:hypothetical protein M3Y98_00056000 [Aphelenchoides besseyi]|nr:hypothetical protein M3Y98_00056000 [Aphelenchoides besseyi]